MGEYGSYDVLDEWRRDVFRNHNQTQSRSFVLAATSRKLGNQTDRNIENSIAGKLLGALGLQSGQSKRYGGAENW